MKRRLLKNSQIKNEFVKLYFFNEKLYVTHEGPENLPIVF